MYGIMLIVVLVITGGAIAFIGDRVGTKVGKKKLSLFGMRPRHTSILVTIITGICITTLTFIILAAASENVRTALFGMEKLNQRMQEAQTRLEQTGQRLGEAELARARADEDLKQAQGEVAKLQQEQSGLEEKARELAAGNQELEYAKQQLLDQNKGLSEENGKLVNGNTVLARSNAKLLNDNRDLEKRAELLRNDIVTVREGDIVFRAGEVIATGIVKGNRPLAEVQEDMGGIIGLANQHVLERLGEEDGKEGVWIYRPEFDQASSYIAEGRLDVIVRLVAAGNLVRGEPVRTTFRLFRNSIVYQENEIIYAQPFEWKAENNAQARELISSFLHEVNRAAQAKGILADPIRGSVGVLEGSQYYAILEELSRQPAGRIIMSAYAKADTNAMGPLRLIMKVEREQR